MNADEFYGKQVLIAGLGKSGAAAFGALLDAGVLPDVYDNRDIEHEEPEFFEKLKGSGAVFYLNGKPVPDKKWDFVIISPGIPLTLALVERAQARGAEVIGELELSYRVGRGRYLAITGTNGKTTTTTLAGAIFAAARLNAVVAGNIGTPVVTKAVNADDDTWLITEVSSFQLETTERFSPKIAILLNLTPDHLDRHITMEKYAAAKAKAFANQGPLDVLVYNADDSIIAALAGRARSRKLPFSRVKEPCGGVFVKDGYIVYEGRRVVGVDELGMSGTHNIENALAAAAAAFAAGITSEVIAETMRRFKGVEHRLEHVATIDGIKFVNDSKGTNPDAAIKAIEAVGEKILLIAGGYDKGADFTEYIRAAKGRVKKIIILGATAEKIINCALENGFAETDLVRVSGMEEAVRSGAELAIPGDTILLSPACASWDMYEDFEKRGLHFKKLVEGFKA